MLESTFTIVKQQIINIFCFMKRMLSEPKLVSNEETSEWVSTLVYHVAKNKI